MITKVCTKCHEEKELSDKNFHRKGAGFYWRCKPCQQEDANEAKRKQTKRRAKKIDSDFIFC